MSLGDLSIYHWIVIIFPFLVAAVLLAHGISRIQRKAIVSGSVVLFFSAIITIIWLFVVWNLLGRLG
jgi:hypothetical protein